MKRSNLLFSASACAVLDNHKTGALLAEEGGE